MSYLPKSKIQTGLYANPSSYPKFKTKIGAPYLGEYYKLYNGKYYSGKDPNDPTTAEIFPIDNSVSNINKNSQIPIGDLFSISIPTDQDYQNGFYTRYFSIRRNQPLIVEINNSSYKKFEQKDTSVPWQLYRVFSLKWELTGDINKVAQTNKNITELTEQREKIIGLSIYLKGNWTQYYKTNP